MGYREAAIAVLKQATRPLTAAEITARAVQKGLIAPTGRTPEASMSAALYTYVVDEPTGSIRKVAEPGPTRAKRDSVRWEYRPHGMAPSR